MSPRLPLVSLLVVNAIACIGTRVSAIAIPWFVLITTGSVTQTGLVAAFELAPYVVVKALGGPLTDRFGQRRISIVADLASMIIIGLIPVAHLLGWLSLPVLLIMVALAGGVRGPGDNAKHTAIPMIAEAVGAPLQRVTGLYSAIERSSGLVAPAIAAVMINAVSSIGAIAVTAGCFGLSAFVVWLGIPRSVACSPDEVATESYSSQLRTGWSFLIKDRLLLTLVGMIMITNLLDVAKTSVLLPVWARGGGHGITSIGILLTSMAAFSVGSSLLASWLGSRLPRRLTYFLAFAIAGPPPFIALALDLPVWAVAIVYAVAGFASGFLNPMIGAIFFERIPRPLVGRVGALADATAWAAMPFGGLLAAGVIALVGLSPTFVILGVAYALATLLPALGSAGRSFDPPARPPLVRSSPTNRWGVPGQVGGEGAAARSQTVSCPVRSAGSAPR